MKILFLLPFLLCANTLLGQSTLTDFNSEDDPEADQEEKNEVSIFPNPVLHTFIIEVELNLIAEQKVSFELYNISGKRVLNIEHLTQPVEIVERGHLPEGFYSYILKTSEKIIKTGKLIFSEF